MGFCEGQSVNEIRSVDEAYSSACNTSNLSVKADQRNDADVLISSGMTPGLLGAALLRLHSEWDGTAKTRKLTETDARLLYGSLKTLPKVIDTVGQWAARKGYRDPYELAGGAVAYWLDCVCHACNGRGRELMPNASRPTLGNICRACGGNGRRRPPAGEAGKDVLRLMDESVERARWSIKKRLRNSE